MAGKCKRRVKRFSRRAAKFLGPVLGALVPQAVSALEVVKDMLPGAFGGHEKRAAVLNVVKVRAKELGHAAYDGAKDALTGEAESYVRAHIENSLDNLRDGQALASLQDWATDEELDADPELADADED